MMAHADDFGLDQYSYKLVLLKPVQENLMPNATVESPTLAQKTRKDGAPEHLAPEQLKRAGLKTENRELRTENCSYNSYFFIK